MANEQELENKQSMQTRPAGNKDLWLFLIILDAIFLCVFGFFVYQHFSTRVFKPSVPIAQGVSVAQNDALETTNSEILVTEETISTEDKKEEMLETVSIVEGPKPAETTVADLLKGTTQEEPVAAVEQDEQKQSIIVAPGKGKYRQVTFRWFGEGKKVAVVSGFTMSKPKELKKVGDYWETTLAIAPGTYKFLYVIDGKNTLDPYVSQKDGRSLLEVK